MLNGCLSQETEDKSLLRTPSPRMDSNILNIEEIVMGRAIPNQTVQVPPEKPVPLNGPPPPPIQPYQHENLQCFQCFITFCSAKAKERHMKKSHREEYKQQLQQGNTLFTCYVCDRSFHSSEELTQHQPTHSKDDKPFKCVHCKESFKMFSELTSHRRQVCPERQFVCKDCNEVFRSVALLRTHRLTQHPRLDDEPTEQLEDPTKTHRCKKCGHSFDTEQELIEHQEKYPDGQQCNDSSSPVKRRGRPLRTEDPAAHEKRGKKKKKEEIEVPVKALKAVGTKESAEASPEEKGKAGRTKRGRPPKLVSTKLATEKEKSNKVDIESSSKGKKTKASSVPPRQHSCSACQLTFQSLGQLRSHKKEKHAPRKAHPCRECNDSFARSEQLEIHMTRAHVAGRFVCTICGKSFGRERILKAHQKSHPEDKPGKPKTVR